MYKENRASLLIHLKSYCEKMGGTAEGLLLLKGGVSRNRNDTDHEELFRQESYFSFLFGVDEPDWYGAVDTTTGEATLFCPR